MDRRYRIFLYFLAMLIVGSLLLYWLSGAVRVPVPSSVQDASSLQPPPVAPPVATPQPTPEGAGYVPPYAPDYQNPSIAKEETSKVRDVPPAEQQSPKGMANSSDLQPPAPPPTVAPDDAEETPDRDQYTTSPKSSNAALRETLQPKGR